MQLSAAARARLVVPQEVGYVVAERVLWPTRASQYTSVADDSIFEVGPLYESDCHGFLVAASPAAAVRSSNAGRTRPPRAALLRVTASGRGWQRTGTGEWRVPFVTVTGAQQLLSC